MTLSIPPTGTQTFAVPAQNLSVLRRLQQSGETAASLQLDFVRETVTFYRVRVLQVLSASSANNVDLITVTLTYESRMVGGNGFAQQGDDDQAQTIFGQIQADSQRQQAERFRIMQTTQTQIFQVQQDVTINKAKSADKAFKAMSDYIRS